MSVMNTGIVEKLKQLMILYPENETTQLKTGFCYQEQILDKQFIWKCLVNLSATLAEPQDFVYLAWRHVLESHDNIEVKPTYYFLIRKGGQKPVYLSMVDNSIRAISDSGLNAVSRIEPLVDKLIERKELDSVVSKSNIDDFTTSVLELYELTYHKLRSKHVTHPGSPGIVVSDGRRDCWEFDFVKEYKTYSMSKELSLNDFVSYQFSFSDVTRSRNVSIRHHPNGKYRVDFHKPEWAVSDKERLGLHFAIHVIKTILRNVLYDDTDLVSHIDRLRTYCPITEKERSMIEVEDFVWL